MKKLLAIIMLLALVISATASYAAENDASQTVLSEMTEEECIAFVLAQGIEIPSVLEDDAQLGNFIKRIITATEQDPNVNLTGTTV